MTSSDTPPKTRLPPHPRGRRPTAKLDLLCLAALVGLSACQEAAAPPVKPILMVRTQAATPVDDAPTVILSGEIRAQVETVASFRVGGRVAERRVEVGERVAAGDILASLDSQEKDSNLTIAQAAVQAAEAQLRQATSHYERQKTLFAQSYTTQREHDQAKEALRTAQGNLKAAQAQLGSARDDLAQTDLRAEVSGVVTARHMEVGHVAQAAQPAFAIARDGAVDAVFNVQESLLVGKPVDHRIDVWLIADPSIRAVGRVREVAPTVDPATGAVRVKIGIDQPPPGMTLGAAVSGQGRLTPRKSAVFPSGALTSRNGTPAVWVVDPQSKTVSLRAVTVERYEAEKVVLRDGLQAGELVVTTGGQFLRPGQSVRQAPES